MSKKISKVVAAAGLLAISAAASAMTAWPQSVNESAPAQSVGPQLARNPAFAGAQAVFPSGFPVSISDSEPSRQWMHQPSDHVGATRGTTTHSIGSARYSVSAFPRSINESNPSD